MAALPLRIQQSAQLQELRHLARARRGPQGLRRIQLVKAPVHDHGHAVRQGAGFLVVVRDVDGGAAQLAQQAAHLGAQALAQVAVQVGQGFVGQHQLRSRHDGPGQCHTLLLAAGQAGRARAPRPCRPTRASTSSTRRAASWRGTPRMRSGKTDIALHAEGAATGR